MNVERKVYEYFDGETMPEDCAKRIEAALEPAAAHKPRKVIPLRRALTTAAILVCLSILTVSGISLAHEGGNLPMESITLSRLNAYHKLFGLETRSQEELAAEEAKKAEAWALAKRYSEAHLTAGNLVEVRDGRLYFIARSENIDITDLCSTEKVFLYTYSDEYGFLHYIGVGGTPKRWGYAEVLLDTQNDHWTVETSHRGLDGDTEEPLGWYVQFKELTGHPWPI